MNRRFKRRWDEPGSIQHVFSHAIEGVPLFVDDTDRAIFLTYLEKALALFDAQLLAFSILHTHYHLMLRLRRMALSRLMKQLLSPYGAAFNRRHERQGYLVDGRFQSILVADELYERRLVRYIVFNRLKAGLARSLDELIADPWTSLGGTLGARTVPYLDAAETLSIFGRNEHDGKRELLGYLREGLGTADPYEGDFVAATAGSLPWMIGPSDLGLSGWAVAKAYDRARNS